MKNLLIASTSTLFDGEYLSYLIPELKLHFKNCATLLFIPFARPGGISHDEYTNKARNFFDQFGIKVQGLHEFENPIEAVENANGIFTGGGNTFLLVSQLYHFNVMQKLKETLLAGIPYLGTSAGSNIAGISMQNTNDMPIIYPPSFDTLSLLPFNLNPHYSDPDVQSNHMGETRETRIKEFHTLNDTAVLGLREGSWLAVLGDDIILKGKLKARLFTKNKLPEELEPETNLNFLYKKNLKN